VWDPAGLAPDHYRIVVRTFLTDGSHYDEIVYFLVDFSRHAAWADIANAYFPSHFLLRDMDGDGDAEIIRPGFTEVKVQNHDGTSALGWPQTIDDIASGIAVGDISGDGHPDVVTMNRQGTLYAWHGDGTLVAGFPFLLLEMGDLLAEGRIALGDMNRDGRNDIVVVEGVSGDLRVVDGTGLVLDGWTRSFGAPVTLPSIGDLDADGQNEIVLLAYAETRKVYVVGPHGVRPGWPKSFSAAPSNAALGDLDRDGDLEIVLGDGNGFVHALHHNGMAVRGWPRFTQALHVNSPVLGDVDGDGRLEVFASTRTLNGQTSDEEGIPPGPKEVRMFAWRSDGTPLPGWPVLYDKELVNGGLGFGVPILADVDGDGRVDVVSGNDGVGIDDASFGLVAYRIDGSKVTGFPKPTDSPDLIETFSPAVADVDGDGLFELAFITNRQFRIWDLPGRSSGPAPWPMAQQNTRLTGVAPKARRTTR